MALFSNDEVKFIAAECGLKNYETCQYELENYSEKLVGYLGEHLRMFLKVTSCGRIYEKVLFVKCMPRSDEYKAMYLKKTGFFQKEYALLSSLFTQFVKREGSSKWRPDSVYLKDEVFVFEDVTNIGYALSDSRKPFSYEETIAAVESVAKFHADSLIFEHKKSKQLQRPYYVWEDFQEYLYEPVSGHPWRDTGRRAVIDILKLYSAHKDLPNFSNCLENILTNLFRRATDSMQPSVKYRNVVVHRDIWSNNIFFKTINGSKHALIVDFQTALYTIPTHDLASLLFFNTTKKFRKEYTEKILETYYACLSVILKDAGLNVSDIFDKQTLSIAYEESIVFGATQAALVLPIANMSDCLKEKYCRSGNEEFDSISRSHCFIESLQSDECYRDRILELFDDIVERFVLPATVINK